MSTPEQNSPLEKNGSNPTEKISTISVAKPKIHYLHEFFLREHPVHITIIGAGGTGTMLVKELARMHCALISMGHPGLFVTIYDHDVVTESNAFRQLYFQEDVGQNKAINIIHKINLAWGIHWRAAPEKFGSKSNPANIVISCVDSFYSRNVIAQALELKDGERTHSIFQIPYYWIDCGNGKSFGQLFLWTYNEAKRKQSSVKYYVVNKIPYNKIFDNKEDKPDEPSCSLAQALGKQDLMINPTIAQAAATMLWSLIHKKYLDYKGVYVNLETMNMRPLPL